MFTIDPEEIKHKRKVLNIKDWFSYIGGQDRVLFAILSVLIGKYLNTN